jgi:hypothetical protein
MTENSNLQDAHAYELYGPTAAGMKKKLAPKSKSNDAGLIVGGILGILFVLGIGIVGLLDSSASHHLSQVAPVASATWTQSRIDSAPATARNTNTPPAQPKVNPVQPGYTNPVNPTKPQPSIKSTGGSTVGS